MPRRIVDVIVASAGPKFSPRRVDLVHPSLGLLQLVLWLLNDAQESLYANLITVEVTHL